MIQGANYAHNYYNYPIRLLITPTDKHGQTALHEICRGWHPDVAKFALQHGAEINKPDIFGRTPLHLACAVNFEDMVEFLVHNGG